MHGLLVQWDPTASFDLNSAIDYYEGIRERNAKFADQSNLSHSASSWRVNQTFIFVRHAGSPSDQKAVQGQL